MIREKINFLPAILFFITIFILKYSLSNSNLDLSRIGSFLSTLDARVHVLQRLEDGEISCTLQSNLIKSVSAFNSLNGVDSFNTLYC